MNQTIRKELTREQAIERLFDVYGLTHQALMLNLNYQELCAMRHGEHRSIGLIVLFEEGKIKYYYRRRMNEPTRT